MKTKEATRRQVLGDEDPSDGVVRVIERLGPFHAQGLENLAGMGVSARQGDGWDFIHLDFELSCGRANIRLSEKLLSLALRMCHVELRRVNCDRIPHQTYEYFLGKGDISIVAEQKTAVDKDVAVSAEGGAGGEIGPLKARLSAMFRLGARASQKRASATRSSETVQPRIDLIVAAGQDRWQVGHPKRGDARRDDGVLSGTYFGEKRDQKGEPKPLCVLARQSKAAAVEVTISVLAPVSQVLVSNSDGTSAVDDIQSLQGALRRRGGGAAKSHERALREIRERMAGLLVANALRDSQCGADVVAPEGSFLIGMTTLRLPPWGEGGV